MAPDRHVKVYATTKPEKANDAKAITHDDFMAGWPSRSIADAWITHEGASHPSSIFDWGYDWKKAVTIFNKAIEVCDRSKQNAIAKTSGRMGSGGRDTAVTSARRAFFMARGIDLEGTFSAATLFAIGAYTTQEKNMRAQRESRKTPIQYADIKCSRCKRANTICSASKPFTGCLQCPHGACDFAQQQASYVSMKMATTTASLQSFGRNLKKQYGTEGEVMAMRFFNIARDLMKVADVGNPGIHHEFVQCIEAGARKIDPNTTEGQYMLAILRAAGLTR